MIAALTNERSITTLQQMLDYVYAIDKFQPYANQTAITILAFPLRNLGDAVAARYKQLSDNKYAGKKKAKGLRSAHDQRRYERVKNDDQHKILTDFDANPEGFVMFYTARGGFVHSTNSCGHMQNVVSTTFGDCPVNLIPCTHCSVKYLVAKFDFKSRGVTLFITESDMAKFVRSIGTDAFDDIQDEIRRLRGHGAIEAYVRSLNAGFASISGRLLRKMFSAESIVHYDARIAVYGKSDWASDLIADNACFLCGDDSTGVVRIDTQIGESVINCKTTCKPCLGIFKLMNESRPYARIVINNVVAFADSRIADIDYSTRSTISGTTWSTFHKNCDLRNGCGIAFHISEEEYTTLCRGNCVYCGVPGTPGPPNGIDRVDSNIDYTLDNCVSACKICNYMKNTMTRDAFVTQCRRIAAYIVGKVLPHESRTM